LRLRHPFFGFLYVQQGPSVNQPDPSAVSSLSDPTRLDLLRRAGLVDAPPDAAFDRLTLLAARLVGVPVALVSLVDDRRQSFKSCLGLAAPWDEARETPLSHSFCQHVVVSEEPLVVEDAREHPLLRDSLAIPELGVVAYAGFPITTRSGVVLGSFCAIDVRPRRWTPQELETVRELAEAASREVQLRLDVAERTEALEQATAQIASIMEASTDSIVGMTLGGTIAGWSAGAERTYGYTAAEAVGRSLAMLMPPGGEAEAAAILERVRRGETLAHLETVRIRKDGGAVEVSLTVTPVVDPQGAVIGASALARDLTLRRSMDRQIRHSGERFRALVENMHDLISVLDADGTLTYASPSAERLGYQPSELLGRNVLQLLHPDDQPRASAILAEMARRPDDGFRAEMRFCAADGAWRTLEMHGQNLLASPAIRGIVVNSRDVTDREAARAELAESQRQLLQAQKMEAIGQLSGGVAHDFNNLLTVIVGNVDLLRMDAPEDADTRESLDAIRAAAERASALTRQLLAFSRKQVLEPRVVRMNDAVGEVARMLARLINDDVRLRVELDPGAGAVKADPGQLQQVLLNLAVNARDAMPTGGELRIATRAVRLPGPDDPLPAGADPGPYVALEVSDTGCGMDEETRARIFEPFFTTKEPGRGTGLGLSTAYGIVRQSGGHVSVRSAPGRGSTFTVHLPRTDETEGEPAPAEAPAAPAAGGTLLVVEDEVEVRRIIRRALSGAGFTVLEAGSGAEALRTLEERGGAVDLVLTDVVMAGMSGAALAAAARERWPRLPVVLMSGYTDEEIAPHGVMRGGGHVIDKPFTPAELVRQIRAALAEHAGREGQG
jgi:two-component system cell cycle sensor histidine kinase/response regulator CckA